MCREAATGIRARSNSSIPAPTGAELMFIASRSSQLAKEQVNSPLASMFAWLSLRPTDENSTKGGLSLMALKKL